MNTLDTITQNMSNSNMSPEMQAYFKQNPDALNGTDGTNNGNSNTNTTKTPAGGTGNPQDDRNGDTTQNNNGGTDTTGNDKNGTNTETSTDPYAGIDSKAKDIVDKGTSQISDLQTSLGNLRSMVDTGTASLIQGLTQMYSARIDAVKDAYTRKGAATETNNFRNGEARYTPGQASGELTNIEVQGQIAIANLQGQMMTAIARATQARDNNDIKLFNQEYDKVHAARKDIQTEVANLYKEASQQAASIAKEKQLQLQQSKADLTASMSLSKRAAPGLVTALSSLKTPEEKANLISAFAEKHNLDPDVLIGDIQTASNAQDKTDLGLENIRSQIKNRGLKKTGGTKTTSTKPIISGGLTTTHDEIGTVKDLLIKGGTWEGKKYNGKGSDGYYDPTLYKAMADWWDTKGGLSQDFVKQFPPDKFVNPKSNKDMPTYLQNHSKK
jgi:Skp family chaperone for outer membrane proteins